MSMMAMRRMMAWKRVISTKFRGNFTDVTLADKETNLILTDKVNWAIQGNVTMKVTQPVGLLWNQCKRRHLWWPYFEPIYNKSKNANFGTNASGAIWWPNLQPIQEVSLKSISNYSSWEIYSSYGLNTLGPLCLWQCFLLSRAGYQVQS